MHCTSDIHGVRRLTFGVCRGCLANLGTGGPLVGLAMGIPMQIPMGAPMGNPIKSRGTMELLKMGLQVRPFRTSPSWLACWLLMIRPYGHSTTVPNIIQIALVLGPANRALLRGK